jgi:cytochrome c oxidase cbb3-type subunit 4
MDINTLRVIVTVVALITFLGIVAWAWSSRRRAHFEAATRPVLEASDVDPKERQP